MVKVFRNNLFAISEQGDQWLRNIQFKPGFKGAPEVSGYGIRTAIAEQSGIFGKGSFTMGRGHAATAIGTPIISGRA
ncbi:hypothetical protein [Mucilaginibacter gilvus]|uniref:Uncharacterized protein n=1 Tax=Mucilaginibacter gilvus TaxID=2305909 RepID=A0A3S3VEB5_9SPHI|nr:hypothetical protein [Mucilaginibacter gilvus]RWY51618.1 hypothetical protein EPL05_12115 [Mucilaginibacter gilvus]